MILKQYLSSVDLTYLRYSAIFVTGTTTSHSSSHLVSASMASRKEERAAHASRFLAGESATRTSIAPSSRTTSAAFSDESLRRKDDLSLHELDSLRIQAVLHEKRNRCDAVVQILKRNDEGNGLLRSGDDLQSDLCDDPEGSLRADHKLKQVVTCTCLGNSGTELDDLACGENNSHSTDIVSCAAVLDSAHAACVCGYITAQCSELLARIRGIKEASAKSVLSQIVQKDSGLYADDEIILRYRRREG